MKEVARSSDAMIAYAARQAALIAVWRELGSPRLVAAWTHAVDDGRGGYGFRIVSRELLPDPDTGEPVIREHEPESRTVVWKPDTVGHLARWAAEVVRKAAASAAEHA